MHCQCIATDLHNQIKITYFAIQSTFMDQQHEQQLNDITAIRTMMERASKFLSLSGLSGVMAGLVATIGGIFVYWYLEIHAIDSGLLKNIGFEYPDFRKVVLNVAIVAFLVLSLSVGSAVFFTLRKAKGINKLIFDTNAIRILLSIFVPMLVAAIVILALLTKNYFDLIVPTMFFLYGLGLINAGYFTFRDVSYLGYLELVLGAICLVFPEWSIQLWVVGFGLLHMVYGTIMYLKYDRKEA